MGREAGVADSAIEALGAAASVLPWPQYEQVLFRFLKLMKTVGNKVMVRSLCAVLDSFHFLSPRECLARQEAAEEAARDGERRQRREQQRKAGADAPATAANGVPEAAEEPAAEVEGEEAGQGGKRGADPEEEAEDIKHALQKRVLPVLHEQLVDDEEAVRTPVAIALVKLLRLLPPDVERVELPRALQVSGFGRGMSVRRVDKRGGRDWGGRASEAAAAAATGRGEGGTAAGASGEG